MNDGSLIVNAKNNIFHPYAADNCLVWGVVFEDSEGGHLFGSILKKNFKHCYCFRAEGDGILVMNYLNYRDDIKYLPIEMDDFAANMAISERKVVIIAHKPTFGMFYRVFYTCVSSVIAKLGMRYTLVLTPFQLYNALLKAGASEINLQ